MFARVFRLAEGSGGGVTSRTATDPVASVTGSAHVHRPLSPLGQRPRMTTTTATGVTVVIVIPQPPSTGRCTSATCPGRTWPPTSPPAPPAPAASGSSRRRRRRPPELRADQGREGRRRRREWSPRTASRSSPPGRPGSATTSSSTRRRTDYRQAIAGMLRELVENGTRPDPGDHPAPVRGLRPHPAPLVRGGQVPDLRHRRQRHLLRGLRRLHLGADPARPELRPVRRAAAADGGGRCRCCRWRTTATG